MGENLRSEVERLERLERFAAAVAALAAPPGEGEPAAAPPPPPPAVPPAASGRGSGEELDVADYLEGMRRRASALAEWGE